MKTNNNNNRNENNAAKVAAIVKNEGRIVAAIKKGNHTTREIIPAADMFTEYTEFCEAIAALQIAGMVECRENGYYLTEKGEYLTEYDNETEEAAAEIASESEDETPAETVEVVNETTTAYHHTTAARIAQVCKTIAEAVGVFSGSLYPAADMVQDLNRFAKWDAAAETNEVVNPAAPFWFAVREQGSESGTREHCKERCAVLGRPVYVIKVEREDLPGLFTLKVRVSSRATAEAVTKANEKPDTRKQFADLKTKYPDALLLFSCGDHYETYEEDAQTIAAAFGLTISEEDGHKLAAFPAADLSDYLPALIRKGHRVAICDQLEAPRKIERRRITETVGAQATESHQDSDNDESTNTPATSSEATTEPQSEPSKPAQVAAVVADYMAGTWDSVKTRAPKAWRATTKAARRVAGWVLLLVGCLSTFAVFALVLNVLAIYTPNVLALRLLLLIPAVAVAGAYEYAYIKTFGTIDYYLHLMSEYTRSQAPRW